MLIRGVALLLGLTGLAIVVRLAFVDVVLALRGARTMGRVAEVHEGNADASAATIGFIDATGRGRRFRSDLALAGDRHFVGSAIPVIYDPRHPQRAREADRPLAKTVRTALYGLGVAFLLAFALAPGLADWVLGHLGAPQ